LSFSIPPETKETHEGGRAWFAFPADGKDVERIREFFRAADPSKPCTVTVAETRRKRSLNANAYFWALCSNVAEKVLSTREEVYRKYLRDLSLMDPSVTVSVVVRNEAVGVFMKTWEGQGLGNFSEVSERLERFSKLECHYGSSHFDSRQFSRLLEEVVRDCREMGIETKNRQEIEALVERWGKDNADVDRGGGK
jgi:hypothetical protein